MKKSISIVTGGLIAAIACLTGCMVGPNYSPPDTPMPANYGELREQFVATSTDETAVVEVRWWRRFDDPQLTALVEKAITTNNSVTVAEARLREARAGRQVVQSLLYPRIGVGASVLRFRGSQNALDLPTGMLDMEGSLYQIGFDAAWTVDLFGGIRRSVESAQANEQAVDALRRGVILMVAAETARAYMELRGVQEQLVVAKATLKEQQQTLAVTEDRRKNGLASDLEVVRAATEVQSTASEIPPLQQAIGQYIHVISTLLGLEPTALRGELELAAKLPQSPGQLTVGVPSDLLRRRPDIQVAERQLAASTARVGVATAELFPKVVLGGTAGLASRGTGDLFDGNSSGYYAAGPSINWTIFDGGGRRAGIKLTEAQVEAAKAAYEDTVLRAFREVESALVAVDRAQARVEDLKRLSASAREAADIARRDYERGILDQLTVLDAQRQANRADILRTEGQMSLSVNIIKLYKALGGGWEVAEPVPAIQPASVVQPFNQ